MAIFIGTIISQPALHGNVLLLQMQTGSRVQILVRPNPKDQRLDIVFLCIGQQILVCGQELQGYILATQICILHYLERNYLLPNEEKGVLLYGNYSLDRTEPSN